MFSSGKFEFKEEKETPVSHYYIRSREQHMKPFQDPNSRVSRSGLEVVLFDEIHSTNLRKQRDKCADKVNSTNKDGE